MDRLVEILSGPLRRWDGEMMKFRRFSHNDFAATTFAVLRDRGIVVTDEIKNRINQLTWQRGRWTGEKAWAVTALIQTFWRPRWTMKIKVEFEPVEMTVPKEISAIGDAAQRGEAINDWLSNRFVDTNDGLPLDCGWKIVPAKKTRWINKQYLD